ncbi:hypothetical protein FG386_002305 [Cryptosporidium ryanae]|uniref:uncharacterized protein n=1 Tax=Cryptosporidium ryanae TaxID=515981 RepID=UPI00351A316F|nr:hypothetical protein FG386_002305 [Cryptosporidium ryanae]
MSKLSNSYKEVLSHGDELFKRLGLKPFILNLPFEERNEPLEKGIKSKINNNFSYSHKISRTCGDVAFEKDENEVYSIRISDSSYVPGKKSLDVQSGNRDVASSTVSILGDKNTTGFVFLLVKPMCCCKRNRSSGVSDLDLAQVRSESGRIIRYKPVIGSVVEVIDGSKRCIKAIFCERKMPYSITYKLVRVSLSRILIHSVLWNGKGRSGRNNGNKVICISEEDMLLFPIPAYEILIKEINMSSHWEEDGEAESSGEVNSVSATRKRNTVNRKYSDTLNDHSDYVSANNYTKYGGAYGDNYYIASINRCPCLARFSNKPNYKRFWEITESRLTRMIKFSPGVFGTDVNYSDFTGFRLFRDGGLSPRTGSVSRVEKASSEGLGPDGYAGRECIHGAFRNGGVMMGGNSTGFHTPVKKRRKAETAVT